MFRFLVLTCLLVGIFAKSLDSNNANQRVQNGQNGEIDDFPYLVSLQINVNGDFPHSCGASIINENAIVTAAHCIDSHEENPERFQIRAGSESYNKNGQVRTIKKIFKHEDYVGKDKQFDNDIALLLLSEPLIFDKKIKAIQLPKQGEDVADNLVCEFAGWGESVAGNPGPINFRYAYTSVMNQEQCIKAYVNKTVTNNMICAISSINMDACHGDSGGPFTYGTKLFGITSWGPQCVKDSKEPGVWTRVSKYIDWISDKINQI